MLLPVLGLIGIMKGATIGGAVPAILFNTLDARCFMTAIDGYPWPRTERPGPAGGTFFLTPEYIFRYRAGFLCTLLPSWLNDILICQKKRHCCYSR